MSSANINREFSEFGNKMLIIAILTIVSFVLGFASLISSFIGFVGLFLNIGIFILFFIALGNIYEAGTELNNQNLLEFRSKLIISLILGLIGSFFFVVGIFGLVIVFNAGAILAAIIVFALFIIIGIVLLIIATVFRIIAWSKLKTFFELNASLFPSNIAEDAKSGASLCKIGAILDATIILSFVGDILRIIGYFKLKSLKDLVGAPAVRPAPLPEAPQPAASPKTAANFCPSCGSQIEPGVKYCTECGSEIN